MLALIAGGGDLPRIVASSQDRAPLVCALTGNRRPEGLDVDRWFRLETLGSLLLALGEEGVTEVCLVGGIDRPVLDPTALDDETKPLVPLFMDALQRGDDGALRVILQLFEQTGFTIRAAHDLAPALLPPGGVLTARQWRKSHGIDAEAARKVLADMGRADLGQACVVRKGRVLMREDETGTDAMLSTLALPGAAPLPGGDLARWAGTGDTLSPEALAWLAAVSEDAHDAPGAGAILFKGPKPGQDRRADLPAIGPATALRAAAAGLDGIVIQSGGVMVVHLALTVAILDAMDMFLWVRL